MVNWPTKLALIMHFIISESEAAVAYVNEMFGSEELDEGSDLDEPCDSEASEQVEMDMEDEIDMSLLGDDSETADNSRGVSVLEVSSYYLCCVRFC